MDNKIFEGKFSATPEEIWNAIEGYRLQIGPTDILTEINVEKDKESQIWLGANDSGSPIGRREYLLGIISVTSFASVTLVKIVCGWSPFSDFFGRIEELLKTDASLGFIKSPSVFLSHSSLDKEFVLKLASRLRTYQVNVWVDEAELNVGDSLIDKIGNAIEETDFVIVVLSNNSIKSDWVKKELDIALVKEIEEKAVLVLPILLEKVQIPTALKDKLYADFSDPSDFELSFYKLIKALGIKKAEWGTRLVVPGWEDANFRFLQGKGELKVGKNGPACHIFEAVIFFKDRDFPLSIGESLYSRDELLMKIFFMLHDFPHTGHVPDLYRYISEEIKDKIWELLEEKFDFARPEGL